MKITAIILLSACLAASANSHSQNVTLTLKDAPLEKVFSEIKKQTGYTFVYKTEVLTQTHKVDIAVSNASLQQVLDLCFKDQPLTYKIFQRIIAVKSKDDPTNQIDENLPTPPIDVKGRIVNENGEPVVASIVVKGTQQGTTSNADGYFELKGVDENATLVITGVSIETIEIKVNSRTNLGELVVKTKIAEGQDVVVKTNYWEVKQRENTGNIAKVTAAEIEKQPVLNPLQALQGRIAGLEVIQQTGVPGGNFKVNIRGTNSIANGNDPLYIIDGVPFTSTTLANTTTASGIFPLFDGVSGTNPLNGINPSDIESIEVLKDADATAIYGSRGSNGVILITTKKGKAGQPRLDINFYQGAAQVATKVKLLNTQQYLEMRDEAFANAGLNPGAADFDINGTWSRNRYTDWQEELIGGTAQITDAQASLSGGDSKTQFSFGTGYHRETTVFPGDYADRRFSVRLNVRNTALNEKLRTNLSVNYSVGNSSLVQTDLTGLAYSLAPNAPALYNADGSLNWENSTWSNPLAYLSTSFNSRTATLIGNAVITYLLAEGLEVKTNLGYTNTRADANTLVPKRFTDPAYAQFAQHTSRFSNSNFKNWIAEPQLTWRKKLWRGELNFLAGLSFLEQEAASIGQFASGFANEALMKDIRAATTISVSNNSFYEYRYHAVFGRLNYVLDNKYIINLTGRRDGSSRFGPGKQFANFGAVGVAWLFDKEQFVQKILPFLSSGKIRASYGTSGNDQLPNYAFLDTYTSSTAYGGVPGLNPVRLSNPDYSWELNKKLEIAVELGFWNDRLSINASWYRNRSSNQLTGFPLPPTTGFTTVQGNFPATVQNRGLELELSAGIAQKKDFSWTSSINFSIYRNKLLSFPDISLFPSSYTSRYEVGQPLNITRSYRYVGIDPVTGFYQVEDVNGDGSINTADRVVTNQLNATLFGGVGNSFTYKGFNLDLFFQFVCQDSRGYINNYPTPGFSMRNQPSLVMQRRKQPSDDADLQLFSRASAASTAYGRYNLSDGNIVNASYIRLKNISLSYALPKKFVARWGMENLRFFVLGQNLFTITSFKGSDPETKSITTLPPLRVITAGLNLVF